MNRREGEPVAAASPFMPSMESSELLSQLFAEHHRRILIAAWRITGSMADAEDVAQAVFLRLAGGKGPPIANAGSYLYRAAINGALDLLRQRKSAPAEPLEAANEVTAWQGSSPEADASNREIGAWLRLAIGELAPRAGIQVEYSPMEIAGKKYICPTKSVSILQAHTGQQSGMVSKEHYKGSAKTYLNDVAFGQYRRFGSETRILAGDDGDSSQPRWPASADAPYSPPSRTATH